jgi:hypothetical protein
LFAIQVGLRTIFLGLLAIVVGGQSILLGLCPVFICLITIFLGLCPIFLSLLAILICLHPVFLRLFAIFFHLFDDLFDQCIILTEFRLRNFFTIYLHLHDFCSIEVNLIRMSVFIRIDVRITGSRTADAGL